MTILYLRISNGQPPFKVTWLRQYVYELKQENEQLKADLTAIKAKLGME